MKKLEIFLCQLAFGGYPVNPEDQKAAKESLIYKKIEENFNQGQYKELWNYEQNKINK